MRRTIAHLSFDLLHCLLHSHKVLARGHEEMVICMERWPGGKAVVYYRPHMHKQWERMSIEDFQGKLINEGTWFTSGQM
jgi:hypothetical protein